MSQILTEHIDHNQYDPDVVTPPGETLQEVLDQRGLTQAGLAERIGLAQKTVNEIIRGKAPLTPATALALETALGVPASFRNRYESAYRESLARSERLLRLADTAHWISELPWREAVAAGWIRQCRTQVDQLVEILRYFGVASPRQYEEVYGGLAVQWKRPATSSPNPHAVTFWLRRGELIAHELGGAAHLVWRDYDAGAFERCLNRARPLTREREPAVLERSLQQLGASAGVAVAFVPELRGTCAGGATRWLSPTRALIQLSLRYKTNDALWFHFFHEAAHVLRHRKKRVFVELDGMGVDDLDERDADAFAERALIPPRSWGAFVARGRPTKAATETFAKEIGVDPGIVVGRLQKERLVPYDWFNDLKQRYVWELVPTP